jgi:hypothetical protein
VGSGRKVLVVPETAEEFHARLSAHADDAGRLPLPEQSTWKILPVADLGSTVGG